MPRPPPTIQPSANGIAKPSDDPHARTACRSRASTRSLTRSGAKRSRSAVPTVSNSQPTWACQRPLIAPQKPGAAQVRRMRVAVVVGERVVLAVVGDPGDHRALHRHRAEHRDDRAERARGLERAVGEHPVVAERHAERGDHVEADHQRQLERPDRAVPQQHDRDDQADQRQRRRRSGSRSCARGSSGNRGYVAERKFLLRAVRRAAPRTCSVWYDEMADQPWHELPPEIAAVLRPVLAEVADEMIEAVGTVPAYARPLEGPVRRGHPRRRAGGAAPLPRRDRGRRAGSALGRLHRARPGRDARRAEPRLAAERLPDRRARRLAAVRGGRRGRRGSSPTTLYLLAESIFAYIDVLSAESAEGYALEQSAVAGEAELRRRRLVRMLVREPPRRAERGRGGRQRGRLAAAARRWRCSRSAASGREPRLLAAAGGRDRRGDRRADLRDRARPRGPGPPGRDRAGGRSTPARAPGSGRPLTWAEAALSFARARAALALGDGDGRRWWSPASGPASCCCAATQRLAQELAADRLAPLAGLSPGSRARLTETLRAWLAEQGRLGPVAQRLGIHPQTARYRLARLRELFGDALDDPDERFWLELALRGVGGAERRCSARLRAAPARGSGSGSGSIGTSGPSAPAAISSCQTYDDRDLDSGPSCARGTRSSRARPSSGTSPPWTRTTPSG